MRYLKDFNNLNLLLEAKMFYNSDFKNIVASTWQKTKSPIAQLILDYFGNDVDINFNYIGLSKNIGFVNFLQDDKVVGEKTYKLPVNFFSNGGSVLTSTSLYGSAYGLDGTSITNDILNDIDMNQNTIDVRNDRFKVILEFNYGRPASHKMFKIERLSDSNKYILYWGMNSGASLEPELGDIKYSEMRLGKFVRNFLNAIKYKYVDKDIENFVESFNATYKELNADLEIVKGDDIKYWYLEDRYASAAGSLGGSCMRFKSCQNFFGIYVDNPEVCQMAILKDEDGKLIGRALLWTDVDGKKYIDNPYTIRDYLAKVFYSWGERNGYNRMSGLDVKVDIKPLDYKKFPYVDNLSYYYVDANFLSNRYYKDLVGTTKIYSLDETNGGYDEYSNNE